MEKKDRTSKNHISFELPYYEKLNKVFSRPPFPG